MPDAIMVTSSFLPGRGGIESYLAELCAAISPRVSVLAPARREGRTLPHDLGYETIAGPGSMLVPGRRVVSATVTAARAAGVDKILFGTPWPLILTGPELRRRDLRYAAIVHASEMLVPAAIPFVGARLARALAKAEVLFAVSDFTAGQIERVLRRHRRTAPPIERLRARVDLARFHPGAGGDRIRAQHAIAPDARVVLCFGRLVRRKGVHRLLAIADRLGREVSELVIVIAGTGPEHRRLQRQARELETRVIFLGRVEEEAAAATYASADVFALPVVDRYFGLETEGLGVVLLEAAACELPCVTGRSGGTSEAVVHGRTGYVVDARERDELIEALSALLMKPDRAHEMGKAGREHVAQRYSSATPPAALLRWLDG